MGLIYFSETLECKYQSTLRNVQKRENIYTAAEA